MSKDVPPGYSGYPPQDGQGYPPQAGYGYPASGGAQYNQQTTGHTTVVVNQPMPGAPGAIPRDWSTGICDICEDIPICLCGTFCGLCLACRVAMDMQESCLVPWCVPGADITLRVKWRTQENIGGSICDDCINISCCGPCSLCQLAREVEKKKKGTLYSYTR